MAAAAIGMASLLSSSVLGADDDVPVSFTALAASMALVAYLVRQLPARMAALGTAALVGGMVVSLTARSRSLLGDSSTSLILLFLLGVSIAASWY